MPYSPIVGGPVPQVKGRFGRKCEQIWNGGEDVVGEALQSLVKHFTVRRRGTRSSGGCSGLGMAVLVHRHRSAQGFAIYSSTKDAGIIRASSTIRAEVYHRVLFLESVWQVAW